MNIRIAKEEIALLMPSSLSHYADEPRFDAPARQNGLVAAFASAIRWLADLPRRNAVLAELSELSDHELADIGLTRSELGRVFDPEFVAQRGRGSLGRAQIA